MPWSIVVGLTLLTLLPALLLSMTPLVRLLVVFHFLRQALGTQTAPSNPTLLGLALMMTWFLMTPVLTLVDQQAVEPYRSGQITGMEAIDRGSVPVKHFLLRYARERVLWFRPFPQGNPAHGGVYPRLGLRRFDPLRRTSTADFSGMGNSLFHNPSCI